MPSIYELVTANALSAYWTELNSNRLPYLGAALFPAKRMMGLKLSWIRGVNNLPVMLAPSAFDTKPTLRDRGGVNTFETKMPFFRESMRIGEEDRQQMLQLLQAGGNYIQPILTKIFDDASVLIDGALVIPEVMIWNYCRPERSLFSHLTRTALTLITTTTMTLTVRGLQAT